jgi:purine-nucleoside/S-methyl-5'-thioadenosine phosphorylase / adenosine deaminase
VGDAELAAAVGGGRIVQVKQVHGARAVLAAEAALSSLAGEAPSLAGGAQEADALVAPSAGAVGVRVADCVPVLVASTETGAVAAIHAGWRGVVAGVVPAGVELLGRGGLLAAIGPCIGACCFEVGADVAEHFVSRRGAIGFVTRRAGDKAYVDLRAAVRAQLRALGLADDAIDDVPGCTKHEPDRFHSFRRDGANSGRMLAAIATRAECRTRRISGRNGLEH